MATSKRKDFTQTAFDVVRQAIGDAPTQKPAPPMKNGTTKKLAPASGRKETPKKRVKS